MQSSKRSNKTSHSGDIFRAPQGGGNGGRAGRVIFAFLIVVAVFSAIMIIQRTVDYKRADSLYKKNYIKSLEDDGNGLSIFGDSIKKASGNEEADDIDIDDGDMTVSRPDFAAMKQDLPDVIGYIEVGESVLAYPVVQGSDNDFYLDHLADKSPGRSGAIFLDSGCKRDFSGDISIIYGHMMNNGMMFSPLKQYRDEDFARENDIIKIYTEEEEISARLYSVFLADGIHESYPLGFIEDKKRTGFLKEVRKRSLVNLDIEEELPEPDRRIIVLSTCAYDFKEARLVLVAVEDR